MLLTFGRFNVTKMYVTEDAGSTVLGVICRNHFGFLNQRSKGLPMPEECLVCEKILECMNAKSKAKTHQVDTKTESKGIEKTEPAIIIEEINENFEKPKRIMRQLEKED